MSNIKQLKQMIAEPASKKWFKKYGLPKGIKNHIAYKMSSKGELAKAEKGEKQHTGYESKSDWVKRQKSFHKKHGKFDSRTTLEANEGKQYSNKKRAELESESRWGKGFNEMGMPYK